MRTNSGLFFWGAALITAGALALAVQAGLVQPDAFTDAWRLWPLILIAIGIGLLLSRSGLAWAGALVGGVVLGILGGALLSVGPTVGACSGEPQESHSASGMLDAQTAEVEVDFSCGDLEISTAGGTQWELNARGDEPRVEEEAGRVELRTDDGPPFGVGRSRNGWELTLPADATLDLNVSLNAGNGVLTLTGIRATELSLDLNAGDVTLDLSGSDVAELDVGVNAGSATVIVDADTQLTGTLEANAGSVSLCEAERTDLAITTEDAIAFRHNLDDSGLSRSGNRWHRSIPNENAVTLRVDGNAASFTLNPEQGC